MKSLARVIHITGTDTGVGKSLFAALLLHHLRESGFQALGLKPIATGDRADALLLQSVMDGELELGEINPFHFKAPIAPVLAARREGRKLRLGAVVKHVKTFQRGCEILVVEGAGSLMSPLGEGFTGLDLIRRIGGEVIVVLPNRLGAVGQTLAVLSALEPVEVKDIKCVMMSHSRQLDKKLGTMELIREFGKVAVLDLGYLGGKCSEKAGIKKIYEKVKKPLARWRNDDTLHARSIER